LRIRARAAPFAGKRKGCGTRQSAAMLHPDRTYNPDRLCSLRRLAERRRESLWPTRRPHPPLPALPTFLPCEINPLIFSGLYGVPRRHFFLYPRLMTAIRPLLGTPRLPREHPVWKRASCAPTNLWSGRAFCVPAPLSGILTPSKRMLKLPALQQLGGRSIATKGSRFSLAGHWPLVTDHCFCKPFRMNVYKLPFCYPLYNECLCHVGGGGGVQGV